MILKISFNYSLVRESQCLKQIEIDEKFGGTSLIKKEEKK